MRYSDIVMDSNWGHFVYALKSMHYFIAAVLLNQLLVTGPNVTKLVPINI